MNHAGATGLKTVVFVLLLSALSAACGKKGDPVPPADEVDEEQAAQNQG